MRTKAFGLFVVLVFCLLVWALGAIPVTAAESQTPPLPAQPAAAPATGEQPAPGPAQAAVATTSPAPPQSAEYRIQPGDVLAITVLASAEYSGSFPVQSDGTILFHDDMVGSVSVAGCTVKDASARLTSRIGEYIKDPTVVLSIGQFRVMVMGEVQRPGSTDVPAGTRLMDVVDRAGGPKDAKKDLARVYLTKVSGQELRYSLKDFKDRGDASQNPMVDPGDRVSVGRLPGTKPVQYKVSGAVAKPGSFDLDETEEPRVFDAIKEAGRWTDDGNPRRTQLIHKDGTKTTLDLMRIESDLRDDENSLLRDGDEVFVPRNSVTVNVLGGVKKPGPYKVAPGTTLLEVISTAGGLEDSAVLKECAIVRNEPTPMRIAVNLERLTKQGDMTQNPVLEDRDVVFLPARPANTSKTSGTNWFQSVTDAAWRIFAVTRWVGF
jgi:polysaccharide export outer membrane protein